VLPNNGQMLLNEPKEPKLEIFMTKILELEADIAKRDFERCLSIY